MSKPPDPVDTARPRRRLWRRWITFGEAIGVGALIIAGLGYLDAHRERVVARAAQAVSARLDANRSALVLRGVTDNGARIALSPVDSAQVVQSERYLFPRAVLSHAMEISSAAPQIDGDWVRAGLLGAYRARKTHGLFEGEAPVGVVTDYVQDGAPRRDIALYRFGYRVEPRGFLQSPRLTLLGVSLVRRETSSGLRSAVERAWAASITG